MRRTLRFLSSVKLAIVLLILLAAASVVGTLIPQGRAAEEYAARYGGLSGLLQGLQLTRLYRSVWFLALLAFFALNVVVCTLTRLSPKLRRAFRPSLAADPKALAALSVKDRFKRGAPLAEVRPGVESALRQAGYRVRAAGSGTRLTLLARKRTAGIFGSDIVHLGLLVILAGGIVSGLGSAKSEVPLREGETKAVPGAGFSVRLDKFETELYPDGNVKDWKSTVTVIENGAPGPARTIEVNHPLTYKGVSLYQMSYGYDWDSARLEIAAKRTGDPAYAKTWTLKPGERVPAGDPQGTEIVVARFLPDFVLGQGDEPQTRSPQPNNPAALIQGWRAGAKVFEGWVFANFPDFAQMHGAQTSDLAFELKHVAASGQYSVLEAAHDPGVPLIWAGCVLLMAGLGLAFYWTPREIRAVLEEAQGRTEITAGGIAAKARERFAAEFEAVLAPLRRPK